MRFYLSTVVTMVTQNSVMLLCFSVSLKEDLKFNETALEHLKLALYVFQESVSEILGIINVVP